MAKLLSLTFLAISTLAVAADSVDIGSSLSGDTAVTKALKGGQSTLNTTASQEKANAYADGSKLTTAQKTSLSEANANARAIGNTNTLTTLSSSGAMTQVQFNGLPLYEEARSASGTLLATRKYTACQTNSDGTVKSIWVRVNSTDVTGYQDCLRSKTGTIQTDSAGVARADLPDITPVYAQGQTVTNSVQTGTSLNATTLASASTGSGSVVSGGSLNGGGTVTATTSASYTFAVGAAALTSLKAGGTAVEQTMTSDLSIGGLTFKAPTLTWTTVVGSNGYQWDLARIDSAVCGQTIVGGMCSCDITALKKQGYTTDKANSVCSAFNKADAAGAIWSNYSTTALTTSNGATYSALGSLVNDRPLQIGGSFSASKGNYVQLAIDANTSLKLSYHCADTANAYASKIACTFTMVKTASTTVDENNSKGKAALSSSLTTGNNATGAMVAAGSREEYYNGLAANAKYLKSCVKQMNTQSETGKTITTCADNDGNNPYAAGVQNGSFSTDDGCYLVADDSSYVTKTDAQTFSCIITNPVAYYTCNTTVAKKQCTITRVKSAKDFTCTAVRLNATFDWLADGDVNVYQGYRETSSNCDAYDDSVGPAAWPNVYACTLTSTTVDSESDVTSAYPTPNSSDATAGAPAGAPEGWPELTLVNHDMGNSWSVKQQNVTKHYSCYDRTDTTTEVSSCSASDLSGGTLIDDTENTMIFPWANRPLECASVVGTNKQGCTKWTRSYVYPDQVSTSCVATDSTGAAATLAGDASKVCANQGKGELNSCNGSDWFARKAWRATWDADPLLNSDYALYSETCHINYIDSSGAQVNHLIEQITDPNSAAIGCGYCTNRNTTDLCYSTTSTTASDTCSAKATEYTNNSYTCTYVTDASQATYVNVGSGTLQTEETRKYTCTKTSTVPTAYKKVCSNALDVDSMSKGTESLMDTSTTTDMSGIGKIATMSALADKLSTAYSEQNLTVTEVSSDTMSSQTGAIQLFAGVNNQCQRGASISNALVNNCCRTDLTRSGGSKLFGKCGETDVQLAAARRNNRTHYVGEWCSKKIKVIFTSWCTEETQSYCTFDSLLTKTLQEQGRAQLNEMAAGGVVIQGTCTNGICDNNTGVDSFTPQFKFYTDAPAAYTNAATAAARIAQIQQWNSSPLSLDTAFRQGAWVTTDSTGARLQSQDKDVGIYRRPWYCQYEDSKVLGANSYFASCENSTSQVFAICNTAGQGACLTETGGWPASYMYFSTNPTTGVGMQVYFVDTFDYKNQFLTEDILLAGGCDGNAACSYSMKSLKTTGAWGAYVLKTVSFPMIDTSSSTSGTTVADTTSLTTGAGLTTASSSQGDSITNLGDYIFKPFSKTGTFTEADMASGGALSTATIRFSTDAGSTWSDLVLPAKLALNDANGLVVVKPSAGTTYVDVQHNQIQALDGLLYVVAGECNWASNLCRYTFRGLTAIRPKPWGAPQGPDCSGFTPSQFGVLDFNKMDFSEWIADMTSKVTAGVSSTEQTAIADELTARMKAETNAMLGTSSSSSSSSTTTGVLKTTGKKSLTGLRQVGTVSTTSGLLTSSEDTVDTVAGAAPKLANMSATDLWIVSTATKQVLMNVVANYPRAPIDKTTGKPAVDPLTKIISRDDPVLKVDIDWGDCSAHSVSEDLSAWPDGRFPSAFVTDSQVCTCDAGGTFPDCTEVCSEVSTGSCHSSEGGEWCDTTTVCSAPSTCKAVSTNSYATDLATKALLVKKTGKYTSVNRATANNESGNVSASEDTMVGLSWLASHNYASGMVWQASPPSCSNAPVQKYVNGVAYYEVHPQVKLWSSTSYSKNNGQPYIVNLWMNNYLDDMKDRVNPANESGVEDINAEFEQTGFTYTTLKQSVSRKNVRGAVKLDGTEKTTREQELDKQLIPTD